MQLDNYFKVYGLTAQPAKRILAIGILYSTKSNNEFVDSYFFIEKIKLRYDLILTADWKLKRIRKLTNLNKKVFVVVMG